MNSQTLKHQVLIADDDRAIREALVRALNLEGYAVTSVNDGAKALEAVKAETPDVLILDLMMPVIDGMTVCRVLRAEKNRVPILMLTARTETSDRVAGLDAGADDYLPKPFALDELLARLRVLYGAMTLMMISIRLRFSHLMIFVLTWRHGVFFVVTMKLNCLRPSLSCWNFWCAIVESSWITPRSTTESGVTILALSQRIWQCISVISVAKLTLLIANNSFTPYVAWVTRQG